MLKIQVHIQVHQVDMKPTDSKTHSEVFEQPGASGGQPSLDPAQQAPRPVQQIWLSAVPFDSCTKLKVMNVKGNDLFCLYF